MVAFSTHGETDQRFLNSNHIHDTARSAKSAMSFSRRRMKDQAAVRLACEAFQSGLDIAGRARPDGERLHA
jgi:hypothetical protein